MKKYLVLFGLVALAACDEGPTVPAAPESQPPVAPVMALSATFAPPSGALEVVDVDARLVGNPGGPAVSSTILTAGVEYRITVEGNWSAWRPTDWSCTSPFPTRFLSPSVPDGTNAGFDAEWRYANAGNCNVADSRYPGIQFSLDGTTTWVDPTPVDATFNADHRYEYLVTGQGHALRLYIPDTNGDNHGVMKVAIAEEPTELVFTSGSDVTAWNAIPATGPFSGYHDDGISRLCVANPAVGLDADWTNPHGAFEVGPATFEGWSGFDAQWINAWPSIQAADIAPGGQYNPAYGSGYGTTNETNLPGKNWTRYQTQVSGDGDFVLYLHADNCSWIYLSDENGNGPQLVGVQLDSNSGTYGVTLSGVHTLDFIIYDGGGQAGGKYRLETTTNPPAPLNLDSTAPVITATVDGDLGDNLWYTSNVTVSWTVIDDESDVTSTEGCETTTVTADTGGVTFTCTATSAGGEDSESVTIKRDATAPTVSVVLGGTLHDGWYNTDVTVAWTTGDNLSGIASDTCDDNTVTEDGNPISQECTVTDEAGNSATGTTGDFKRDGTDPTVTYSGNAGSYDVAEFVGITCEATDNLSGIASDTCADLSGAAYTFGLGTTSFSASAEDVAGNTGSASGSFEVTASLDGLCTLVQRFVSHGGVANSLCAKTSAADRARNDKAHDGALGAFISEVEAQSGKKIDADDALVLITIANALIG